MIQTAPIPFCNFLISSVALGAPEEALELLQSTLIILINPLLKLSLYRANTAQLAAINTVYQAVQCYLAPPRSLVPTHRTHLQALAAFGISGSVSSGDSPRLGQLLHLVADSTDWDYLAHFILSGLLLRCLRSSS